MARTKKTSAVRERRAAYKTTARPNLTPAETRALDELRARLKEILPGDALKSLILYGSKARGDAHPWSDIDLLIVYDSARGEKKDAIWDATQAIEDEMFELTANPDFDLEPFVMTKQELQKSQQLGTPLLQNIAREGIVLEGENIVPEKMNRQYWIDNHLAGAKRTLRSARLLLADGDVRNAISAAYFIYLDAARAALIAKGIAPKSHSGTRKLFSDYFIRTGLLAKKFGPHFGRLENDRLEATYTKEKQYTTEDAERALAIAEELLTEVERRIPDWLKEQ